MWTKDKTKHAPLHAKLFPEVLTVKSMAVYRKTLDELVARRMKRFNKRHNIIQAEPEKPPPTIVKCDCAKRRKDKLEKRKARKQRQSEPQISNLRTEIEELKVINAKIELKNVFNDAGFIDGKRSVGLPSTNFETKQNGRISSPPTDLGTKPKQFGMYSTVTETKQVGTPSTKPETKQGFWNRLYHGKKTVPTPGRTPDRHGIFPNKPPDEWAGLNLEPQSLYDTTKNLPLRGTYSYK
jgi:predicted RNA-binding protein